ncbi:hypothetical protein HZB02_06640, partial [Candidatus Woesearchaeota archaeon]|nr:hypothetical protein [Candidatus Woesearchaeota archaeon]
MKFAGFDLEKVLRDDEERMRLEAERLTKKAAAAGKGGKPKTPPAVLRTP